MAIVSTLILSGCSDPADSVHKTSADAAHDAPETAAAAKRYVIQPESAIGFVGSKVTGSHDGGFKEFEGTINVVDGAVAPATQVTIKMDSTWSDNENLTGHLKSPDFFNVEEHPEATFTVTAVEPAETGSKVTGNLNLHGVTKSISFPATITVTDEAVAVNAEFAINRKDFNINYPGKPDDLIRDNVVIKLDIKGKPAGV